MIKSIDAKLEISEAAWKTHGEGSSSLTTVGLADTQVRICVGQLIVSFDGGKTFFRADEIIALLKPMSLEEIDED